MSTAVPLAQAINSTFSNSKSETQEEQREELAVLEGHDADIPTEVQGSSGLKGAHIAYSHKPSVAAHHTPPSTAPETASSSHPSQPPQVSHHTTLPLTEEAKSSSHDLAPSTVAQWVPSTVPEAASSTVPDVASSTDPEKAPSTVPQAVPSTFAETAPSTAPEVEPFPALEKAPSTALQSATSSAAEANPSTNGHPEKESHTTSKLEKEIDLEAGNGSLSSARKGPETTKTEVDPNIVDWDGPDDPQNPINWPEKLKWGNVAVIASITFLTPLASSMFAPGVPDVMKEFNSNNEQLASFVVSIYILGYAFGPLAVAPLSELYGRLPIYHVCNILFVVFTIACALSTNLSMLIGFRFLEGLFGSCPLTIGGGTIADMIVQEKRGGVIAIWALGPLMGPVVGPVTGGYLSQAKGWRWVFWVIAMAAGAISISALVFLRETYPPIVLERKAARLRKETGNENLTSKLKSPLTPAALFKVSIIRPMKFLLFSPIVLALSTYMAVVYGYLYLLFTTITEVYEKQYHFSQGSVGLTYLGIGIGSLFGVVIFGIASDRIVKYMSKNGEMKAEYRLPPMIPGSFLIPIGLFLYGWTADKHVFWIVPILGTGLVGLGLLATFMPIQTYLVDAFTIYAASALAANTVLRSLVGALLPLAGQKMYATLGLGWGNSLLAFIALAMCPIPWFFFRYGERIRKSPRFQINL